MDAGITDSMISGNGGTEQRRNSRAALANLAGLLLVAVAAFAAGFFTERIASADDALPAGGANYVLPINSEQLTVTFVPLRPSAKVEALITHAGSGTEATARGLVSEEGIVLLKSELRELYPFQYATGEALTIPDELFDFDRQQYKTSALLDWMYGELDPASFKSVGVLYADVFDDDYNFLFGQARLAGPLCVVSSARMGQQIENARQSASERWHSVCRHELGHTLGLRHVPDRSSVMAFGNSVSELDTQGNTLTKADWAELKRLHPIRWGE